MPLLKKAKAVQKNAYAPYSDYKVGAAIKTKSGTIYVGCNVENAAYPEGTCAEAGAIAAMIAAGETEIVEALVISGNEQPASPCGGCRQKLAEFAKPNTPVHLANKDTVQLTKTVGDLLPGGFTKESLD